MTFAAEEPAQSNSPAFVHYYGTSTSKHHGIQAVDLFINVSFYSYTFTLYTG